MKAGPSEASSAARHYQALGLVILAAALMSIGGLLIKLVTWHPVAIAGARSGIAVIALLVLAGRPRPTWSTAQVLGALCYTTTVLLFVIANKLTTAANAILLTFTSPIFAALLGGWFLQERVRGRDWVALTITVAAMILFFLDRLEPGNFLGNLCAIGSAVAFAGMLVSLRAQKNGSSVETFVLGGLITCFIGLPFMLRSAPGGAGWPGLIVLGVLQLALPFWLYSKALQQLTALEASLAQTVEPVLNPVWVFLATGEAPGVWAVVGGITVLVTVTLRQFSDVLLRRLLHSSSNQGSKIT